MKNLSAANLLLALGFSLTLGACSKDTTTTPTPAAPTTPSPSTPALRTVNGVAMSGVLVSLRMNYNYPLPQSPVPIALDIESAVAAFYTGTASTFVDAGTVAVNTHNLDKSSNNAYVKAGNFSTSTTGQTTTDLGFDTGSSWSVSGASGVTAFNYNHTTAMPSLPASYTFPTTVTKASGLTVPLGATGADSTYVVVISGDKQVLKRVRGNASSVTFTAADLNALPTNSDNTALIEIVPFKYTLQFINSKYYVFVKEYAAVSNIKVQ